MSNKARGVARIRISLRLPSLHLARSQLLAAWAIAAVVAFGPQEEVLAAVRTSNSMISFANVGASGIFDPSIADTPPGERMWMSYSAVDPSPGWPDTNTRTMTTRLAYSDDRGATWSDLGAVVNPIHEATDGAERRTWSNEVSSLVYDPLGAADARWKLFWHHYPAIGEDRQFQHGWIAYKQAATPQGLAAATEIKLFGAKGYKDVNNVKFGETASPLGGPPAIRVNTLGGGADDCIALSEPGAMATKDGLYLAAGCYAFRPIPPHVEGRIILMKCAAGCSPQQSDSWKVIGTVLSAKDAKAYGAGGVSAADLFEQNGKAYLIVSPVGNRPVRGAYQGCYVFRFSSLANGTLEQSNGQHTVIKKIMGQPGTFNGACTYAPGATTAGFLYSEIKFADRPIFQIFKSGEGL